VLAVCQTLSNSVAPSYTTSLQASTDYEWWVETVNQAGVVGNLSAIDAFTTGSAGVGGTQTVKLTWAWSGVDVNKRKETLSGFQIFRASSLNGSYAPITTVGASVRTYTDASAPLPTACYKVIPVDTAGNAGAAILGTCAYGQGATVDLDNIAPEPTHAVTVEVQ
jgi:hypothetical protein